MVFLIVACSTEKNTPITRTYHNVTSIYNILFNGKESFREGMEKYDKAYNDDYSRILPVFTYGEENLAGSIQPQMDRTIEKCSKVISLHSITVKPDAKKSVMSEKEKAFYQQSEYNKYVDDSYLLMGKAQFYSNKYLEAERTFRYVMNEYNYEETSYMARIWLARTYIERNDFSEAEENLKRLQEDNEFPEDFYDELYSSLAHFYLTQRNLEQAETNLKKALESTRGKDRKLRYTFILAQLNEELEDVEEARDFYEKVVKMNPPYEMAFNAKVRKATMYKGLSSADMIKELEKMLRDDKNIEYQDQIYYALAEIEMQKGNKNKALEYYTKSVQANVKNKNQKGLSYLAMADIYFERNDYEPAQAYYDSSVNALEQNYPGYTKLYMKTQYLTRLVDNINVVELQDSLQWIASMTEKERTQFIQKIIKDVVEAERLEREKARQEASSGVFAPSGRRFNANTGEDGKWYFYSPTAKSYGEPEFKRRWGERTLEDNWRRKNKKMASSLLSGTQNPSEEEDADEESSGLTNKDPEFYLQNVPLTDSMMQVSHEKIQKGLFGQAQVYFNDLSDTPKSIDALKDLIDRYPSGDYKVPAYYFLYQIYQDDADYQQAERYKNLIVDNHPESKYAKVLTDPNFIKNIQKEEEEQLAYYNDLLDAYNQGNYQTVLDMTATGMQKYEETDILPKLTYLQALATGGYYGTAEMRAALKEVIKEFPEDEVANAAQKQLEFLDENELQQLTAGTGETAPRKPQKDERDERSAKPDEERTESSVSYSYEPEDEHYFVLVVSKGADINQLRFNVINFNLDYYLQKDYSTDLKTLNKYLETIVVKKFSNKEEGMNYFNTFKAREERVMGEYMNQSHQFFIISLDNYIALFNAKSLSSYILFYEQNY